MQAIQRRISKDVLSLNGPNSTTTASRRGQRNLNRETTDRGWKEVEISNSVSQSELKIPPISGEVVSQKSGDKYVLIPMLNSTKSSR